jgi:hypothetical protein
MADPPTAQMFGAHDGSEPFAGHFLRQHPRGSGGSRRCRFLALRSVLSWFCFWHRCVLGFPAALDLNALPSGLLAVPRAQTGPLEKVATLGGIDRSQQRRRGDL